ncbi:4Fe-4S dicluster domain-containing protein, partial [Dehalococcoidia bacterium]|nr:4Fe-4S dicluster domain-containing protein [Dehalococcoidia bacterium]
MPLLPLSLGKGFPGTFGPRDQDLYKCVHCGLCLNVCPTYIETSLETESPRGRIALMKALREQRVGLTSRVVSHMDLCLQCRACETACPSGVPFGRLMESTREQIASHHKGPLLRRLAMYIAFRHLLPHPRRLYILGGVLRFYQHTPINWLASRLLPQPIRQLLLSLPTFSKLFFRPRDYVIQPQGVP